MRLGFQHGVERSPKNQTHCCGCGSGVLSVPETRRLISVSSREAVMLQKTYGELAAGRTIHYRRKILGFFDFLLMTASGPAGSTRKHRGERR